MNNTTAVKKRDYSLDSIKFILIFLVVLGHLIEANSSKFYTSLYTFIYYFHMPFFIFISGYFSKKFSWENIKKLILIYIIMQALYVALQIYITGDIAQLDLLKYIIQPAWLVWYLMSLIWFKLIALKINKSSYILPAIIVAVLVGFLPFVDTQFSLSRTITFFPFFLMGLNFNKAQFHNFFKSKKYIVVSILIILTFLAISLFYFSDFWYQALYLRESYYNFDSIYIAALIRISVYIIAPLIIASILIIIPNKKYNILSLGKNTLYAYVLHGVIIKVAEKFGFYEIASLNQYYILISLALTIILLYIPTLFNKPKKK